MALGFSFDRTFSTGGPNVTWAEATTGAGTFTGVSNPGGVVALHLVAYGAIQTNDDVAIVPISLFAGQTLSLDIDFGAGDALSIDTQVTIIDFDGNLILSQDDGGSLDPGSSSTNDPDFAFTATQTGVYYIAVSHFANNYAGGFQFDGLGTGTGDFQLNLSVTDFGAQTFGTNNDDTFDRRSTNVDQRIVALDGRDTIRLGNGQNVVDAGAGEDDVFGGSSNDQLYGGVSDDFISAGGSADVVVGGSGADELFGDGGDDQILGGESEDFMDGGSENDFLRGAAGDDTLVGGRGDDTLNGSGGEDTADYAGGGGVAVNLAFAFSQDTGAQGFDTLLSIENVVGSSFADNITGSNKNNVLDGGRGNDLLAGGGGEDILIGGIGRDQMRGGNGADVFMFRTLDEFASKSGRDVIIDFKRADILDLQGVDADVTRSGNQAFDFIGKTGFSGEAGELRYTASGGSVLITADIDGDGAGDIRIELSNVSSLASGDFLL